MPDIDFRILGVEPAAHGLLPLLRFKLQVEEKLPPGASVVMGGASGEPLGAPASLPATVRHGQSAGRDAGAPRAPVAETIQAVLLHVQIQLQPAQRAYKAPERE